MKTLITAMLFIYSISIAAQQPLDTIYANSKKNVAMFFPKPIRQAITGASNFVFTYNGEKEQYFGLLQAQKGEESNLLTVTNDGNVYSYVLKYADKLPKLNYFINEANSIGNEKPKIINALKEKKTVNHNGDKIEYFERACVYLLKSKYKTLATKRENNIRLQLQKMVYDGDEVYLVIEIKNTSGINFELDYLNIYSVNGNSKKKASYQSLKQEVIFKYKTPSKILNGQSQRFVYVLPKFVLGDNEKLMIELKELKGSRRVVLKK